MKLGIDIDVERRRLEPRAGEAFDARRSERLDVAIHVAEIATDYRRPTQIERAVRRFLERDRA